MNRAMWPVVVLVVLGSVWVVGPALWNLVPVAWREERPAPRPVSALPSPFGFVGEYKETYKEGWTAAKGGYSDGRRVGRWVFRDAEGLATEEVWFEDGRPVRWRIANTACRAGALSGDYLPTNDSTDEKCYKWLFRVLIRGVLDDGWWTGTVRVREHDIGAFEAGKFHKGVREGLWSFHLEGGMIEKLGRFRNGDKHGLWTYYDRDGRIGQQDFYESGGIDLGKQLRQPPWAGGMLDHSRGRD
ncbi:MAG: toxin-antitoxin system YwqK family antitoxin [Planctomycetota bacterium]